MAGPNGIQLFGGTDEILEFGSIVRTIPVVLDTDQNIGNVIKAAHNEAAKAFITHMTRVATAAPSKFKHMYEWGMVGAPNARLWKHTLQGAGRSRKAFFQFVPSKSIVPVHPDLAAVGVKKRHRFAMKAPVMEYGYKVSISPKLAKVLVYLAKGAAPDRVSSGGSRAWIKNGIAYNAGTVQIERAGNANIWGSFTSAYVEWWSGSGARIAIEERVIKKMSVTISRQTAARLAKVGKKPRKVPTKTGQLQVTAVDPELETKLINALYHDYTSEALNRTVI